MSGMVEKGQFRTFGSFGAMPHPDGLTRETNTHESSGCVATAGPTSAIFGSYLVQTILRFVQVPIGAAGLEDLLRLLGTRLGQQLIASR